MGIFSDILLTADYDRTLTGPDSVIPERNLTAIRYFLENGGTFTVNTGRSLPMTKVFRDIVPVNAPLLLYNGSVAYDVKTGEVLFCHAIQRNMADVIRECMEAFPDMTVEVQNLDAHYRFAENPAWDAFSEYQNCAHAAADPEDDLGTFMKFTLYGQIRDVKLKDLFEGSPAEIRRMNEVEAELKRRFGDSCEVFRAALRIIDVHAKGVSKARSARQLQRHLGKRYLVCVGDGENDVSMLQDADFAYSPADAVVADRFENVCNCAEGAVADVIYRKIPQILEKDA